MELTPVSVARADVAPLVHALRRWEHESGTMLHAGDVGWFLRLPDNQIEGGLLGWESRNGEVAAVGLVDDDTLRLGLSPELVGTEGGRALGARLEAAGWTAVDPWPVYYRLTEHGHGPADPGVRPVGGDDDVVGRVAAQRAAFRGSTFTVESWHRVAASPAYDPSCDLLIRDRSERVVAAATGWLSRPAACALLEPVGVVPEHQGRGYGRRIVLAACRALAGAGASGVRVLPDESNAGVVAFYRSCGFRPVEPARTFPAGYWQRRALVAAGTPLSAAIYGRPLRPER